jgi:elongation factor P--beta-lysine ligase
VPVDYQGPVIGEHRWYFEVDTPVLVACTGVETHPEYFATEWVDAAFKAFAGLSLVDGDPGLAGMEGAVLYDYVPSQAVLAKVENGRAKRFEFYIGWIDICNSFLELTDPAPDEEFFEALEAWMPPCAGNALGFDRWFALLLVLEGIARTIPFRASDAFRGKAQCGAEPRGDGSVIFRQILEMR